MKIPKIEIYKDSDYGIDYNGYIVVTIKDGEDAFKPLKPIWEILNKEQLYRLSIGYVIKINKFIFKNYFEKIN